MCYLNNDIIYSRLVSEREVHFEALMDSIFIAGKERKGFSLPPSPVAHSVASQDTTLVSVLWGLPQIL